MYEISFWVTVCTYAFITSLLKTYVHECGHLLALRFTDRLLRKDKTSYPNYLPHKHVMKVFLGAGRTDSRLYSFLVEEKRLGLLRLNAIAGVFAECTYCFALRFVTYFIFKDILLSFVISGAFIFISLALFFASGIQHQGDFKIFLCPKLFYGMFESGEFSVSKRIQGSLMIFFEVAIAVALFVLL
jgi:hypothetical protein